MQNSLSDPFLISQYHKEYLTLINHYDNFKRPGMFIRYYNINYHESDRHPVVESTFDLYSLSNINFNIYELTPVYNIAPVMNSTTFLSDKKGQIYDGVSSITIYTIQTPHVNDLVTFYDPVKSGEIFRVMNIRTSINAYYSEPNLTWYEMDLEVAPIKDTSALKVSNHYIYDLHQEKYHNYTDYTTKMTFIETVNSMISQIRQFYGRNHDLYKADDLVPLISNNTITNFKDITTTDDNYVRVFNDLEKPYGLSDLLNTISLADESFVINDIVYDYDALVLDVYNLTTSEMEEYTWDQNEESDLNTLLTLTRNLKVLIDSNSQYF
jgi:hypothetical protein